MAKVFAAPEPAPTVDYKNYDYKVEEQRETEYIERMKQAARDAHPGDPYAGEMYYVPRGDGNAIYVVWSGKPLELIWLQIGDAWRASAAEERGLRLSDIKAHMNFEKMWRELGEKQAAEAKA